MSDDIRILNENEELRDLVKKAALGVIKNSGNSYVDAWTQQWLESAKRLGCYSGEVVGMVDDLQLSQLELLNNEGA